MGRSADVTPALTQHLAAFLYLSLHLLRRAPRQSLLDVNGPVERQPVTELFRVYME
jgi:hypothetical protein